MKYIIFYILAITIMPLLSQKNYAAEKPNILLILTDDLGYSDLGCYGSEIETPYLDNLAQNGVCFTHFYNTAKCHTSRISLLTGQYPLAAGESAMANAVTSAEILGEAGYFTAMTGKWHLSKEPTDWGFHRYFGHLSGATNYFKGNKTFRLNGNRWIVPDEGFYTTTANVDFALDFIAEARQANKPWFTYIAFNAPHAPLQVLPEDYAKYQSRYKLGWDYIRSQRAEKQRQLGLFPRNMSVPPRPEHIPAWDEMDDYRQKYESKRMAALAGMIDRVDQELGRVIEDLRKNGEIDNTLILFLSDNGASPYDRNPHRYLDDPTTYRSALGDSTGWAWVRNTPFRFYKQNQYEGGVLTSAVLHWPAGVDLKPGAIVDTPAHLIDVLPTLVEVANTEIPPQWQGRILRPVSGVSLVPIFQGKDLERNKPLFLHFQRERGLRDGDWKIVAFAGKKWELYNLKDDPTEMNDISDAYRERTEQMVNTWFEMGALEFHLPEKFLNPAKQSATPHKNNEWTDFNLDLRKAK